MRGRKGAGLEPSPPVGSSRAHPSPLVGSSRAHPSPASSPPEPTTGAAGETRPGAILGRFGREVPKRRGSPDFPAEPKSGLERAHPSPPQVERGKRPPGPFWGDLGGGSPNGGDPPISPLEPTSGLGRSRRRRRNRNRTSDACQAHSPRRELSKHVRHTPHSDCVVVCSEIQ